LSSLGIIYIYILFLIAKMSLYAFLLMLLLRVRSHSCRILNYWNFHASLIASFLTQDSFFYVPWLSSASAVTGRVYNQAKGSQLQTVAAVRHYKQLTGSLELVWSKCWTVWGFSVDRFSDSHIIGPYINRFSDAYLCISLSIIFWTNSVVKGHSG